MSNLVDNAIKYAREGGRVSISGKVEGGVCTLEVSDDGPGIPADELPRIFERFYRVDKGRSREMGGTGLELSIVKQLVEMHYGRIWMKSSGVPGEGSVFSFTLPVDEKQ